MKVIIKARAFADVAKIYNWIAQDSPANARSVADRIFAAIEDNVAPFPFIGRAGRKRGTREWVVSGLPYIVIYEVDKSRKAVVVRAIYHCAQRR